MNQKTEQSASCMLILSFRDRLEQFFSVHCTSRLNRVDEYVQRFAGREQEMMDALISKYGPEPIADTAAAPLSSSISTPARAGVSLVVRPPSQTWRERLVAFSAHFTPERVDRVDELLERYAGRETELFQALVARYGSEPIVASPAGDGGSDAVPSSVVAPPIAVYPPNK